jgi:hypothetical protein
VARRGERGPRDGAHRPDLRRFLGLGKFRAEAAAGYSTLQDIVGLDLRDATTGRIIRPASEPVAEWSKVRWFRTARRFDRYKLSK